MSSQYLRFPLLSTLFVWMAIPLCVSQQTHPLTPLNPLEISRVSSIVSASHPLPPPYSWMFIWITLKEPAKSQLLPFFLNDTDYPPPQLFTRKSLVVAVHPQTGETFEGVVNLDTGNVESWTSLGTGVDSTFAADELNFVGELALQDPLVQERLAAYGTFYETLQMWFMTFGGFYS